MKTQKFKKNEKEKKSLIEKQITKLKETQPKLKPSESGMRRMQTSRYSQSSFTG